MVCGWFIWTENWWNQQEISLATRTNTTLMLDDVMTLHDVAAIDLSPYYTSAQTCHRPSASDLGQRSGLGCQPAHMGAPEGQQNQARGGGGVGSNFSCTSKSNSMKFIHKICVIEFLLYVKRQFDVVQFVLIGSNLLQLVPIRSNSFQFVPFSDQLCYEASPHSRLERVHSSHGFHKKMHNKVSKLVFGSVTTWSLSGNYASLRSVFKKRTVSLTNRAKP